MALFKFLVKRMHFISNFYFYKLNMMEVYTYKQLNIQRHKIKIWWS